MAKFPLAILFAASAAAVQAQPTTAQVTVQPFVDSVEDRRALRDLSACLAEARPRWARRTLSHPYLSSGQTTEASTALQATGSCMKGEEVELKMRTAGLVGGMAEHFLQAEPIDLPRLTTVLNKLTALNASEDFALCVAAHDPAAARDLTFSEPGGAAESEAARQVAAQIAPCARPGETLAVDLQSLRALVATALYRGASALEATN